MKKIFYFLSLSLFTLNVSAFEGFLCNPSERQTRMQALIKNDQIEVRITNPSGYEFMPQFEGPVSKFSMGYQKFQFDSLEILGDLFVITWPKSSCEVDFKKYYLKCDGEGSLSAKGLSTKDLTSKGLETINMTEQYYFGTYESRKYRFTFDKNGNYLFVVLQFNTDNCKIF